MKNWSKSDQGRNGDLTEIVTIRILPLELKQRGFGGILSWNDFKQFDKAIFSLGNSTLGWASVTGHFLAVELVPARYADRIPVLSALAGIYPRN